MKSRGVHWISICGLCCCAAQLSCNPPSPLGNDNAAPFMCPTGTTGGPTTVSFSQDIMPLFESAGCLASTCHDAGILVSSEYRLVSYDDVFGPGEEAAMFGICNVVPGNADASYMIEKLLPNPREGDRMPQEGDPLTEEQIDLIRTWIDEGAQDN